MAETSPVTVTVPRLQQLKADAIAMRERLAGLGVTAILEDPEPVEGPLQEDPRDNKIAALARQVERLAEFVTTELAYNLVPLHEQMVDAVHDEVLGEVADLAMQVDGIINNEEVLQPDTAQQILGVFEAGRVVCNLLEKTLPRLDQVSKKRCVDAIRLYRGGVTAMVPVIEAITLDEDDEDDGDAAETQDEAPAAADEAAGEAPDPDTVATVEG